MNAAPVASDNSGCPRCGQPFHCGASEGHCACFELTLSVALQQRLSQEFKGCLCLRCLQTLQAQDQPAHQPPAWP